MTHHLRIMQVNQHKPPLAFPEDIAGVVNNLFQGQYRTGQNLIDELEIAKTSIIDTYVGMLPAPQHFSYYFMDDRLVFRLNVSENNVNGSRIVNFVTNIPESKIMSAIASFVGNYNHLRDSLDPNDGPIEITRTTDDRVDMQYVENGRTALNEFKSLFGENSIGQYGMLNLPENQHIAAQMVIKQRRE
jgi:hypothetical protein